MQSMVLITIRCYVTSFQDARALHYEQSEGAPMRCSIDPNIPHIDEP